MRQFSGDYRNEITYAAFRLQILLGTIRSLELQRTGIAPLPCPQNAVNRKPTTCSKLEYKIEIWYNEYH